MQVIAGFFSLGARATLLGHGAALSPYYKKSARCAKLTTSYELCTADRPAFEGQHYRIANLGFYPKPVQKPHPPVWIGGYTQAALRRAVRLEAVSTSFWTYE
jgi:alkanesulfonate monooxygenase SsuD/methylene tetrahydromethanopterin reductase-like flavin-dependent oxidoreductase (luciferase family)